MADELIVNEISHVPNSVEIVKALRSKCIVPNPQCDDHLDIIGDIIVEEEVEEAEEGDLTRQHAADLILYMGNDEVSNELANLRDHKAVAAAVVLVEDDEELITSERDANLVISRFSNEKTDINLILTTSTSTSPISTSSGSPQPTDHHEYLMIHHNPNSQLHHHCRNEIINVNHCGEMFNRSNDDNEEQEEEEVELVVDGDCIRGHEISDCTNNKPDNGPKVVKHASDAECEDDDRGQKSDDDMDCVEGSRCCRDGDGTGETVSDNSVCANEQRMAEFGLVDGKKDEKMVLGLKNFLETTPVDDDNSITGQQQQQRHQQQHHHCTHNSTTANESKEKNKKKMGREVILGIQFAGPDETTVGGERKDVVTGCSGGIIAGGEDDGCCIGDIKKTSCNEIRSSSEAMTSSPTSSSESLSLSTTNSFPNSSSTTVILASHSELMNDCTPDCSATTILMPAIATSIGGDDDAQDPLNQPTTTADSSSSVVKSEVQSMNAIVLYESGSNSSNDFNASSNSRNRDSGENNQAAGKVRKSKEVSSDSQKLDLLNSLLLNPTKTKTKADQEPNNSQQTTPTTIRTKSIIVTKDSSDEKLESPKYLAKRLHMLIKESAYCDEEDDDDVRLDEEDMDTVEVNSITEREDDYKFALPAKCDRACGTADIGEYAMSSSSSSKRVIDPEAASSDLAREEESSSSSASSSKGSKKSSTSAHEVNLYSTKSLPEPESSTSSRTSSICHSRTSKSAPSFNNSSNNSSRYPKSNGNNNVDVDYLLEDSNQLPNNSNLMPNENDFDDDTWATGCEEEDGDESEEICTCRDYTDEEFNASEEDELLPSKDVDLSSYTHDILQEATNDVNNSSSSNSVISRKRKISESNAMISPKLHLDNGLPSKRFASGEKKFNSGSPKTPTSSSSFAMAVIKSNASPCTPTSSQHCLLQLRTPRSLTVLPKENPSAEMYKWLIQFQKWPEHERIMALNNIIDLCEPSQVRHIMKVIEPQFQRDFISLLPRELALQVLSYLEPKDLLRAAQTCRSWRFLCDDNLLWKDKCKQTSIVMEAETDRPKRGRAGNMPPIASPWKAAYMRQHIIEMNWRSRPIRQPKILKGHDDHVITCLQFCGNRIVSGSDDNTLKVWSAVTGKCLRVLVGHTGGVWSSQMSSKFIISGSTDRTLKVWNADSGQCKHTLYGHTSTVRCMHLHGEKVVSGSRDATLRVWDVNEGICLHILVGHLAAVRCVQYDGKLVVSGAYDYTVKVWNPERQECLHTLQGHTNRVYSLQFDGIHVVSGSLDTSIRVWDAETGSCKHTLMGHQSLTSGMELRDNILVSGNADSTVKIWDIISGQCLQTLSGPNKHQSAVTCLQFNSRFVITSSDDGTVKLWDVKTGEFIRNLVALDSGGSGGVVWRIRANDTKLICAVGSRNGTEETKLMVLDFDVEGACLKCS